MLRLLVRLLARMLLSLLVLSATAAIADQAPDPAWADAKTAAEKGPQDIALAGQAVMHLPAGLVFIPQPQAAALLRVMGNPGSYADLQGLVLSQHPGADWFVIVSVEASGHIKDDEAKDWNTDAMLRLVRVSTDASNIERVKSGVPALEIIGWAQRPSYTPATHRLLWAMVSRNQGAPAGAVQGVNYNACVLGREGYLSLNLVTDLPELAAELPEFEGLLAAMAFKPGQRYADFNPSTDAVAKDGLTALVLGVDAGAKKPGLLTKLSALAMALLLLGLLVGIALWRRRRRAKPPAALLLAAPAPIEAFRPTEPDEPPNC